MVSGAHKKVRVEYHRGHFKNPMSDAETEDKFRLLALKRLPSDRVDNLLRLLRGLETLPELCRNLGDEAIRRRGLPALG